MQADLRLCWSHIPHCLKSHVAAELQLQLESCKLFDLMHNVLVNIFSDMSGHFHWLNQYYVVGIKCLAQDTTQCIGEARIRDLSISS